MNVHFGAVPHLRVLCPAAIVHQARGHLHLAGFQAGLVAVRETVGRRHDPLVGHDRARAHHGPVLYDDHERELETVGHVAAGQTGAPHVVAGPAERRVCRPEQQSDEQADEKHFATVVESKGGKNIFENTGRRHAVVVGWKL